MERWRAVLITLVCVLISRISGEDVEMKVRPGENIILYSDCENKIGVTVWFRNSTNEDQPPLSISGEDLIQGAFSHHAFVWNHSNQTQDLLVKNVTESDLGLYYCAHHNTVSTGGRLTHVYRYGNRTTRLSLLEETPSTPPVSDCSVCWKLLVSVCPVCVLLSSVVSSTCVYCIYRNRDKAAVKDGNHGEKTQHHNIRRRDEVGGDDVCYASLDLPNRRQKHLKKKKKKRVESSEFCMYSEVKPVQTEL